MNNIELSSNEDTEASIHPVHFYRTFYLLTCLHVALRLAILTTQCMLHRKRYFFSAETIHSELNSSGKTADLILSYLCHLSTTCLCKHLSLLQVFATCTDIASLTSALFSLWHVQGYSSTTPYNTYLYVTLTL